MLLIISLGTLLLQRWATAEIHHLFASSYRTPNMYALEYNTDTNSLTQVGSFAAHAGHPQLALSYDRTTLYGAERNGWSSYRVITPGELEYQSTQVLRGRCDDRDYKNGNTNMAVEMKPPFNIFGAGRAPCGNVLGTGVDGRVERIVQNISYSPQSRIQGMAVDPANEFLYSADSKADKIWTHKIHPTTGKLSEARSTPLRDGDSKPRKLAVHPNSKYLYVMHSRANKVTVYSIGRGRFGQPSLAATGLSYSLVPPGVNGSSYRGQDLQLSPDNSILYVTTRFRVQKRSDENEDNEEDGEDLEDADDRVGALELDNDRNRTSANTRGYAVEYVIKKLKRQWPFISKGQPWQSAPSAPPAPAVLEPGFLTAILLETQDPPASAPAAKGPVKAAGYPKIVLLQVSTSTSGGRSNAMAPAPWNSEYVALAESEKGLVQVWRFEGVNQIPKGGDLASLPPQQPQPPPVQSSPKPPPQQSSWSPSPSSPQETVWIPPPLKPSSTQIQAEPSQAPPWSQSPASGPSVPGQGQWGSGSGSGSQQGAPLKPAVAVPPPPPQASVPSSSPAPLIMPKSKGAPPPNPLQNSGNSWSNPWASGAKSAGSGAKPKTPTSPDDVIPEFIVPAAKGPKKARARRQEIVVRASIVAEWRSPANVVGQGDPAAPRSDAGTSAKGPPQWGRGCCAAVVWLD